MAKKGKGSDDGNDDYEVGYGKPPKDHQFQPGQSGNPGGRKPGSRGLKTDLNAELSSTLTITINKQPISGTKQRLMLKSLATRAAAGDVRASALLLPLILQIFGIEDRGAERRSLSAQDQAILEEMLAGSGEAILNSTDDGEAGEQGSDRLPTNDADVESDDEPNDE
jgi:hypothetical protein